MVLAPLVLGVLGHDYFLSRNEIPAVVPIAALVAAGACARHAHGFSAQGSRSGC